MSAFPQMTPRRCIRRPNRRSVRFDTRMIGGARRNRSRWLSQALRAYARAIHAHKQLIKLAPRIFDPVVVRREQKQREKDEKWRQMFEAALRRAYGDEAVDKNPWPANDSNSLVPKCPRTLAAIVRMLDERKSWLEIGDAALKNHRERHPRYLPGIATVARLIETAFTLGRLACDMPLEVLPPQPEPDPLPDPLEAVERIYGKSTPDSLESTLLTDE